MTYRTTCPHCASVFRLGMDQLDAAQGWVQCGVCGAAFDAHPSLLMEDGSPLPVATAPEPAEAPPASEALPASEPEGQEAETAADTLVGDTPPTPATFAEEVASTDVPRGIIQRDTPEELPSIILIDPDIPAPEDLGPLPQIYPAPSTYPAEPAASIQASAPTRIASPVTPATPAARIEYAIPPDTTRTHPVRRRLASWAWGGISVLLLVALLGQATYFLRDTLISRLPQTRPALEQACAALGCTLSLPKNLGLLQIVGSDLQTEAGGGLKLTLTLGNRAGHAQAWPVLVLTLTDQRNRPLARRSFAPSEYLADTRRIAVGIPPRSEQLLTLPLTVRDLAPMGFDLQLSY